MNQTSFASAEFAGRKRQTRRERVRAEMNEVVACSRLQPLNKLHGPKSGKVRRPPIGVSSTLRLHFLQQWRRREVWADPRRGLHSGERSRDRA